MKLFFDTSVLIPVFAKEHVHHAASKEAFRQGRREDRSCSAHTLAEFFATLTRLPGKHRLDGSDAFLLIEDILRNAEIVALTADEYVTAIQDAAGSGVGGGTVYDALLILCAVKAEADVIFTWNLKHFQRFPEVRSRIRTP